MSRFVEFRRERVTEFARLWRGVEGVGYFVPDGGDERRVLDGAKSDWSGSQHAIPVAVRTRFERIGDQAGIGLAVETVFTVVEVA